MFAVHAYLNIARTPVLGSEEGGVAKSLCARKGAGEGSKITKSGRTYFIGDLKLVIDKK